MTDAKEPGTPRAIPTLLEAGTRFDGLVSFRGAVRLSGLVVGQVVAEGTLWLAPEAELCGRIEADEVMVEGTCEGEITAHDRIELRPTARVRGRLTTPRLAMADGSVFDGQWEAGAKMAAPELPEPIQARSTAPAERAGTAPIPA